MLYLVEMNLFKIAMKQLGRPLLYGVEGVSPGQALYI